MSTAARKGRAGRPWLRVAAAQRASARRTGAPCWQCGQPIDFDAPPRTPRSFSVDHVLPLSLGGDPYDPGNLRPAHFGCNSARGNRLDVDDDDEPMPTSRAW